MRHAPGCQGPEVLSSAIKPVVGPSPLPALQLRPPVVANSL